MDFLSNPDFRLGEHEDPTEYSGLDDIWGAEKETALTRDMIFNKDQAMWFARQRALDIAKKYGEYHEDPNEAPLMKFTQQGYSNEDYTFGGTSRYEEQKLRQINFETWRRSIAAKIKEEHPEDAEILGMDIDKLSQLVTREKLAAAEDAYRRGPDGIMSWLSSVGGGAQTMFMNAPEIAALMGTGGVGNLAKATTMAVLKNAGKIGILNGLLEVPLSEAAKKHAKESDVPITRQEQAFRVLLAGGLAATLDIGGRGLSRGLVRARGRVLKTDKKGYVRGSQTKEQKAAEEAEEARLEDIETRVRAAETPEEKLAIAAEVLPDSHPIKKVIEGENSDDVADNLLNLHEQGKVDDDVAEFAQSWKRGQGARKALDEEASKIGEEEANELIDSANRNLLEENEPIAVPKEELPETKGPVLADEHPHRTEVALGEKLEVDGKPIYRRTVPFDETEVNAPAYQFKSGTDAKGKNNSLDGAEHFDPTVQGNMYFFEPKAKPPVGEALAKAQKDLAWARRMKTSDGSGPAFQKKVAKERARIDTLKKRVAELEGEAKKPQATKKKYEVGDGHQRWNLAARLRAAGQNTPDFQGFVFREADGWTQADVRAWAAKKNIQEKTAEPIDVATVIRERPDLMDKSVAKENSKFQHGRNLARLSDEAFAAVKGGVISERLGAYIGQYAPDKSAHMGIVEALAKINPSTATQARQIINDLKTLPMHEERTVDMFGETVEQRFLLEERAKIVDSGLGLLKKRAHIFAMLKNHRQKITDAGNVLDEIKNATEETSARQALEVVQKAATLQGRVSDILQEQSKAVAGGKSVKKAAEDWADEVQRVMEEDGVNGLLKTRHTPENNVLDDIESPGAKEDVEALKQDMNDMFGPDENVAKVKVREKPKEGEKPKKADQEKAKLAEAQADMQRAVDKMRAAGHTTKDLDDAITIRKAAEAVKACKL